MEQSCLDEICEASFMTFEGEDRMNASEWPLVRGYAFVKVDLGRSASLLDYGDGCVIAGGLNGKSKDGSRLNYDLSMKRDWASQEMAVEQRWTDESHQIWISIDKKHCYAEHMLSRVFSRLPKVREQLISTREGTYRDSRGLCTMAKFVEQR
jgi:hypothetical protein